MAYLLSTYVIVYLYETDEYLSYLVLQIRQNDIMQLFNQMLSKVIN